MTSYTHQGPLRLISGHLVCRARIPLSSRKMKASFSVEGAFDTLLEKIRNASSLHAVTWGRRMKRSQQELPAYVSFSDSLNLRAFIRHGSGSGFQIWAPLTSTQDSLWLKILFHLFGMQLKKFLLSLDCKCVLLCSFHDFVAPWPCDTLVKNCSVKLWVLLNMHCVQPFAFSEHSQCAGYLACILALKFHNTLEWLSLTPLQMTVNWG